MSHGKPAEAVEMLWVIRGASGSQGLDIQGSTVSKVDSCSSCLAWVHKVPIVVFTRVILGFSVYIPSPPTL